MAEPTQATKPKTAKKTIAKQAAVKTTQAEPEEKTASVYSITVKRDGFRRIGRAWEGTTVLEPDGLTDEQIEILEKDPMFIVVRL